MILRRVDLPAPFSPMRASTSPARTVRSTSVRARTPTNLLLRPVATSTSSAVGRCVTADTTGSPFLLLVAPPVGGQLGARGVLGPGAGGRDRAVQIRC